MAQTVNPGVTILERGPHHRVIESVTVETDATGAHLAVTNRYTQLQTGLHYLKDSEWVDSVPDIVPSLTGAESKRGQHTVEFPNNLRAGIRLTAADGRVLRSVPALLAYCDRETGKQVLLAELKDCQGAIVGTNVVLYSDCTSDFRCEFEYRNYTWGLEQNLIIKENPPPPSAFGLSDATTLLQCWSETFDWPVPQTTARVLRSTPTSERGRFSTFPQLACPGQPLLYSVAHGPKASTPVPGGHLSCHEPGRSSGADFPGRR